MAWWDKKKTKTNTKSKSKTQPKSKPKSQARSQKGSRSMNDPKKTEELTSAVDNFKNVIKKQQDYEKMKKDTESLRQQHGMFRDDIE